MSDTVSDAEVGEQTQTKKKKEDENSNNTGNTK